MTDQKENIILIGAGGHCKSCIEIIESTERFFIVGVLGLPAEVGGAILNYNIIGTDDAIEPLVLKGYSFLITIGQIKSAQIRALIFEKLKTLNAKIATVISPMAYVSKYSEIGRGSIIMHFATVNALAMIGENSILNTGCNVEHDASIGSHTHISTKAVVNGNSKIGDECFVGSNATISNGVSIGSRVVIGAGSVVIGNIPEGAVYVGNPAQRTKNG